MNNVRLKTALNPQQIHNRMKYKPEIVEFHLKEENLYNPEEIVKYIREVKEKGTRVYLHHAMTYRGKYLDIISSSQEMRNFYDWSCKVLALICKQENIKCVIHCHYVQSESNHYVNPAERKETRQRIEEILKICDKSFLWEDTIKGIFSAENPFLLTEIVQPLNLPLNIDISHSFIALKGNNDKLQQHLENYHCFASYYHLVDSNGIKHDSLPLGKGKIDWEMVKSYVKETDFIFEIDLKDSNYMDCSPMIESAEFFNAIKEKFRVN